MLADFVHAGTVFLRRLYVLFASVSGYVDCATIRVTDDAEDASRLLRRVTESLRQLDGTQGRLGLCLPRTIASDGVPSTYGFPGHRNSLADWNKVGNVGVELG